MLLVRKMLKSDTDEVFRMMRDFYSSPAIVHKASDAVLRKDIEDCVSDLPFVEGYVFEKNEETAGYSMVAKSYSTEYGGQCLWIEDLYIKPQFRGRGIGTEFFSYIEGLYKNKAVRFRLEVEKDNKRAIEVYKKCGYKQSPYIDMTKEIRYTDAPRKAKAEVSKRSFT